MMNKKRSQANSKIPQKENVSKVMKSPIDISKEENVTESEKAEEALIEANNKYLTLFNNKTVGLVYTQAIFDINNLPVDYIIHDINTTYEKLAGIKREEIVGKKITEAFPGISQDLIYRHNHVAVTGEECHFEIFEPTIDKWFDVNVFSTKKGYFITIFYNITEQKKMEEALRQSEERFRLVFDSMTENFVIVEPVYDKGDKPVDFRYIEINPIAAGIANMRREEMIGKRLLDLFPASAPEVIQALNVVTETGKPVHIEYFSVVEKRHINFHAWSPKKGQIAAISHDITEARKAENLLKESENSLRAVLGSAVDMLYRRDLRNNCFEYISPSSKKIVGYTPEEFTSMSPAENLSLIHPDDVPAFRSALVTLEEYDEAGVEYRQLAPDGMYRWISNQMTLNRDGNGNPLYRNGSIRDITERKKVEEKFNRSQMIFSELVETSPFGIYIVDSGFCIAHMNSSSQKGAFRNVHPVIGRDFSEAMHVLWPDTVAEGIISEFRHTLNTGESYYSPPFFNPRNDVQIVEAYEWELHRISLPDGQYGVICYYFDSTQLREAERVARDNEEKYRQIVEVANEGIMTADTAGFITFVNKKMADMLGFRIDELIGRRGIDLISPDEINFTKTLDESRKAGKTDSYEIKFIHKNGEIIWTHANGTPIFNGEGLHIGNLAMYTDITCRKQAEDDLKQNQIKLKVALDSGNIGIWEWNLETGEAIWDEKMELMFGIKPGTFGKTYQAFADLVNEEDLLHIQKAIHSAVEHNIPYETVLRTKLKEGKQRYITSKALLSKDNNGKAVSFTGVCFDITELREGTEKLVAKLNEELLRSNKELESFAYVASHDLQEPLRMVTSFTQLLAHHYKDKLDDRAMEYISFAVDGSKRMYDLLNGLLSYSRINSKGKEFDKIDLTEALDNATKNLRLIITEKKVIIKSETLPVVNGDASQLNQLFQNLISNSIKFSMRTPRISISSKSNHDHYIISVKDNGTGIESQYFEKIFQIFQRLHTRDQYEGTGIGLSICRRIVERHGGKIWVESEPGSGSTFFFTIPKI
jgi:PAS domain S-box-containing protein